MSIQPDVILAACPVCGDPTVKIDHTQKCVDAMKRRLRGYQIMTRNTANHIGYMIPPERLWNCERVSGDVECKTCFLLYKDHPEVQPTFVIGCDGKVLKT